MVDELLLVPVPPYDTILLKSRLEAPYVIGISILRLAPISCLMNSLPLL